MQISFAFGSYKFWSVGSALGLSIHINDGTKSGFFFLSLLGQQLSKDNFHDPFLMRIFSWVLQISFFRGLWLLRLSQVHCTIHRISIKSVCCIADKNKQMLNKERNWPRLRKIQHTCIYIYHFLFSTKLFLIKEQKSSLVNPNLKFFWLSNPFS